MRLLIIPVVSFLFLVGSVNPKVLPANHGSKLDIDPITCIECDGVIELFHFINDAIIGGAGEEESKAKVLAFCDQVKPFLKDFCAEVKNGKLWDTIYKALRDSLETFYELVGGLLFNCPELKDVQEQCGHK